MSYQNSFSQLYTLVQLELIPTISNLDWVCFHIWTSDQWKCWAEDYNLVSIFLYVQFHYFVFYHHSRNNYFEAKIFWLRFFEKTHQINWLHNLDSDNLIEWFNFIEMGISVVKILWKVSQNLIANTLVFVFMIFALSDKIILGYWLN